MQNVILFHVHCYVLPECNKSRTALRDPNLTLPLEY